MTSGVDKKFGEAIDLLSAFEKDFPSKPPTSDSNIDVTVTNTSEDASKILHALKYDLHAKVKFLSVSFTSRR